MAAAGYQSGNLYSLDICQEGGCHVGRSKVLAPTDLTLVLSIDVNHTAGDADRLPHLRSRSVG